MQLKAAAFAALFLAACSSSEEGGESSTTEGAVDQTEQVLETNVELEELDGQMDSLLNTLD